MKKKHREKIVNMTMAVLDGILALGAATYDAFIDQKSFYRNSNAGSYTRRQINSRIRDLINSGFLEAKEENGAKSIRLTRKGKIRLLERSLDKRADGKWRFISFDIPENKSISRINLTRSLRRIGFKPVQKSLWVCPYNKADNVTLIVAELGLNDYTAYFVVEHSDIDKHLKDLFDADE
jgi:hypothetical protein